MSEAFLKVVNMSISAGWLVLAVLALRLILKKAPKWVNVLLWGIVAVRLICPFSIESALSLIPSTETISPEIMMDWTPEISTGIEPLDQVVNPVIFTSFAPQGMASANPLQILIPVAANLWLLGVLILLAYTAISYLTLRHKLRTAVILRGNIFQCETVSSPFVLGILKPKIYLPYSMDGNNLDHVVAHEKAHIKRKDHWWKPSGFLLLTVYWFNPLMWVAYILLCRDIELACDEKVIAELGYEQRADYTQALVACAVNRRMIAACPLAFGEVGVKDRIKSIMNYRKPTFWIIVTALVVCIVVAVCFLTDPFEPVFNDVLYQNGYVILSQNDRELTLTVPKDFLPDEIYTAEGYEFDEGQIVAYSTDTTTVWLRKVMLSNESPDQLYFAFDISYEIAEKGTILSIHSCLPNDQYTYRGGLRSKDLRDNNTVYPGAVNTRGHGPDSQFWFYVSTDACKQAEGNLYFEVILNEIEYEADQRDRSFSMSGDNVSDLNPEAIVERILDIENITNSGVYMNSMNFSLQVDSDFNWADSQAVTYFFTKAQTTYNSQLRIFPHEGKYFLTEPSVGQEQQSIYLLRHYLDAIKYLPQDAIRQMALADQYIISHREEGTPGSYDRVITYTQNGAEDIEGWYIHLEIQPLHADGDAFSGTGDEVIHVFYSGNGIAVDRSQLDQLKVNKVLVSRMDVLCGSSSDVTITDQKIISQLLSIYKSVEVEDYSRPLNDERIMLQFFSGDNMVVDWYVSYYEEDDEIVTCGDAFGLGNKRVVGEFDYDWLLSLCAISEIEFTGNRNLGLNAEIIDIDYDQRILYVKDIDESAAVFGDRCAIDCSYAISCDNLIYVNYSEFNDVRAITFEDFEVGDSVIIAMYDSEKDRAFNSSAIAEQIQLGTQKFSNNMLSSMEPTQTNLRGFYGGYLFIPINGSTFRYELTNIDPNTVNAGDFLLTFTEETLIEGIVWEVYSLKEYPDMTKVLAISGTNSAWICEYAPAMQAEEGALEAARDAGYVIVENGYLTNGNDAWKEFYNKTQEGKHATIYLAHYYTLDPDRTVSTTYEALNQDYPALYIHELSYDGDRFVLRTESDVKVYEHLMMYLSSGTPLAGNSEHKQVIHYVLTHDTTHTWEELWGSLASSVLGAVIDHSCSSFSK